MRLFWGEGFLNGFVKAVLMAVVVLFLWGWISHVALGRMTTGQYLRKLSLDLQQGILNETAKFREAGDRIVRNSQTWGQPGL